MDKIEKSEVISVANLANIYIDDNEIELYRLELKKLMDTINRIKDIEIKDENLLITPVKENCSLREDKEKDSITFSEIKKNIPRTLGNFVEVMVMIDE